MKDDSAADGALIHAFFLGYKAANEAREKDETTDGTEVTAQLANWLKMGKAIAALRATSTEEAHDSEIRVLSSALQAHKQRAFDVGYAEGFNSYVKTPNRMEWQTWAHAILIHVLNRSYTESSQIGAIITEAIYGADLICKARRERFPDEKEQNGDVRES